MEKLVLTKYLRSDIIIQLGKYFQGEKIMATRWSYEDECIVKELFELNKSDEEISAALGRTPASIADKRRKLGLLRSKNKYTEQDKETITSMVLANKTNAEIAAILNRTPEAVALQCKKMGLVGIRNTSIRTPSSLKDMALKGGARKLYSDEEELLITRLYTSGVSDDKIASTTGRSVAAIQNYRRSRGLVHTGKEYSIEELQHALHNSPDKRRSYFILNADKLPPISQYIKVWGSWAEALVANGYPLHNSSMDPEKPTTLYILDFSNFYKVGITQNSIRGRFLNLNLPFEVLFEQQYMYKTAKNLEKMILEHFSENKHAPLELQNNGSTECFITSKEELAKIIASLPTNE